MHASRVLLATCFSVMVQSVREQAIALSPLQHGLEGRNLRDAVSLSFHKWQLVTPSHVRRINDIVNLIHHSCEGCVR